MVKITKEFPCDELPESLSAIVDKFPDLCGPYIGEMMREISEILIDGIDTNDEDDLHAPLAGGEIDSEEEGSVLRYPLPRPREPEE